MFNKNGRMSFFGVFFFLFFPPTKSEKSPSRTKKTKTQAHSLALSLSPSLSFSLAFPPIHASPTSFSDSSHSLWPLSPSATSSDTSFSNEPLSFDHDQ